MEGMDDMRNSARGWHEEPSESGDGTSRRRFIGLALGGIAAATGVSAAGLPLKEKAEAAEQSGGLRGAATAGELEILDRIPVEKGIAEVAAAFGSVWVAANNTVTRVNAGTSSIEAKIVVPNLDDYATIAIGRDELWITHNRTQVSRLDPANNEITATVEVAPYVKGVAYGGNHVWVAVEEIDPNTLGTVVKIDPRTQTIAGPPIPVGRGPVWVSYAAGHVWVTLTDFGGVLVKINPVTHLVVDRINRVRTAVSHGGGRLFGTDGVDSVFELDAADAGVVDSRGLERAWDAIYSEGLVWVLTRPGSRDENVSIPNASEPSALHVMSAGTWQRHQSIDMGTSQSRLAIGENAAWIGEYTSGRLTKIGSAA